MHRPRVRTSGRRVVLAAPALLLTLACASEECRTDEECEASHPLCQGGTCTARPFVPGPAVDAGPRPEAGASVPDGGGQDSGLADGGSSADGGADGGVSVDAAPSDIGGWQQMSSGTALDLYDVWSAPGTSTWAVGAQGEIRRLDGTTGSWESAGAVTIHALYSVWGRSDTDLYAVGANGTILQRTASGWTKTADAITGGLSGKTLRSISGDADELWVVGDYGTAARFKSGLGWLMAPPGVLHNLRGVSARNDDAIAVGDNQTVLRWDGVTWRAISPSPPAGNYRDVWHDQGRVWLAGEGGLLVAWDGARFTDHSSGNGSYAGLWSPCGPQAAGGACAGLDLFAVGAGGRIDRFDGAQLAPYPPGTAPPTAGNLNAITGGGSLPRYAVGNGGLILAFR